MNAEKKLAEITSLLGVDNTPIIKRIETKIDLLISKFNNDSKEHSIFDSLNITPYTFKQLDKIQNNEQVENYFFNFYRNANDFEYCDMDSIEEIIREINDFCRDYYFTARKVRYLKVLIK